MRDTGQKKPIHTSDPAPLPSVTAPEPSPAIQQCTTCNARFSGRSLICPLCGKFTDIGIKRTRFFRNKTLLSQKQED